MNGPIRWFIENPIAANLLMVFLIVGGLVGIPMLDKQYFPEFKINKDHRSKCLLINDSNKMKFQRTN